jgi:Cd2+/Zn2+-exporting ATPase
VSKEQKLKLARILLAALLFAAVWCLPLQGWPKAAAYLVPFVLSGYDVMASAVRNILRGVVFDENFLMTIAAGGAFALGDYREAVAVMLFSQIGEFLEDLAVDRSRRNIAALMDIRPDSAVVLRDGAELAVPPENVRVGETIVVKPGERVPLDGVISDGATSVDTAALTGESQPRDLEKGDRILSGSVNLTGLIRVKVDSAFGESTVARILELVEKSSEKKARVEKFITRFARWYTPCVVAVAAVLAVVPPLCFAQPWTVWVNRALIFLVVSCPCALVVSVPLAFFGGIGGASRQGILVKGANYLETLAHIKTAVFDKTGTLTKGVFAVVAIHPASMPKDELLDIAAVAESHSSHPIANSIVAAHGGHIDKSRIASIQERAGLGIEAVIDGRRIFVGNGRLMGEVGAAWHECHRVGTVIHIATEGEYLGHIVISDIIKPDAQEAVANLRGLGVSRIVMLTGDSRKVADAAAAELGVDETRAELLPGNKVAEVEALLPGGSPLAFVGDGVNDAPVLARADIGIAMGALGSDAAIEAADVVLMDDKPSKLALAMRIARKTLVIAKENIVFALAIKIAVLALAAVGIATMWWAVFADVGVTVLAVFNALRTLRRV